MVAKFKIFKSSMLKGRHSVFEEAAEFASTIGEGRMISISHSSGPSSLTAVVWYWDKPNKTQYQIT